MKRQYIIHQDELKTIKKLARYPVYFLLSIIICGCTNNYTKHIQNEVEFKEKQNTEIINDFVNTAETDSNFEISSLYGHWVVGDIVFRDITESSKDGQGDTPFWREDLVGSIIEYSEDFIVLNTVPYEIRKYEYTVDNFNILMRNLNVLNSAHRDYMYDNDLELADCFFVHFEVETHGTYKGPLIGTHFIVLDEDHIIFLSGGCYFNGFRVDINNLEQYKLPVPPEPASPEYLYGNWTVRYPLNEAEKGDVKYIDYSLEYQKDSITLGGIVYANPLYSYDVSLPVDIFRSWFPVVAESEYLGGVSDLHKQYIFIDGIRLEMMGTYLYYVDRNNILVLDDDVFYLATKDSVSLSE